MEEYHMKEYQPRTEEELRAIAATRGCDLLVADESTLLVDLDTISAAVQFKRMISEILDTATGYPSIRDYEILSSRSLNAWHAVIRLNRPLPDLKERIALQAILGSDPLREYLLLNELNLCGSTVNCLFRPKQEQQNG